MRSVLLVGWVGLVVSGCLSPGDGDEVGSETHFLSACVGNEQCDTGLDCVCGVCTRVCDDACELGACAAGDHGAVVAWCTGESLVTGMCLETCVGDADCGGDHRCEDGFCAPAKVAAGELCEVSSECAGGECTLGRCGPACMLGEIECAEDFFCAVPGAAAGVCVPGVIEAFPERLDHGTMRVGESRTLQVTLSNTRAAVSTLVAIQVETRVPDRPPTEVSVAQSTPIRLEAGGLATIDVTVTPQRAGPGAYRLVLRVDESPALGVVEIDFVGSAL